MPGLDGLRGLAVAAVIVYHFEPSLLPGGFIGVDVFFVLSGFLISSLLLHERMVRGSIDFRRFFVRRLRRLMPAILLLLLAVAAYAAFWAEPVELLRLRRHGVGTLTYVTNWIFVADGTTYTDIVAGASPLRHMWSLAIEEQMYIVLALAVVGTAAIGTAAAQRKRFGVLAGSLGLVSAVWMAWLSVGGAPTERTYFGTDTRAHAMLVGAVIGAVLVGRPTADRLLVRVAGWAGLAVLAVIAVVGTEDARWLHRGGFLAVSLAAGAVVVGCASTPSMRSMFSNRPLVTVGTISYGLYLWHWPVLVVFDARRTGLDGAALTSLRLVISLVVAAASYVIVEQPIRSGALGRRWNNGTAVPATMSFALVAAILVASTVVPVPVDPPIIVGAGTTAESGTTVPQTGATEAPSARVPAGSLDVAPPAADGGLDDQADAVPSAPAGPVRVAVLGDSVMHTIIGGEVMPAGLEFVPWSPDQTTFDPQLVDVVSIAKPACSFFPGELAILGPNGSYNHASMERFCGDWRAEFSAALDSVDVVAVHLSNDLDDRWIDGSLFPFGTPAYFGILGEFLDGLHVEAAAAGVPMLLLASAPRSDPLWQDAAGEREARVAAFYEQWASTRSDVSTIDIGTLLCPDGSCPTQIGGVEWRWDGRHYTRLGALSVARWLTPAIRDAANAGS